MSIKSRKPWIDYWKSQVSIESDFVKLDYALHMSENSAYSWEAVNSYDSYYSPNYASERALWHHNQALGILKAYK